MDIYQRLEQDHDRQRDLAARLVETSGDSEERRQLWSEFKAEAEAHANAEEQTFYAALIEDPDTQEKARHSVSEHKTASDHIEKLSELDMSSGAWLQTFQTLKEELEHHVEEEENEVFPKARTVISDDEAARMADDFETRKSEELNAV